MARIRRHVPVALTSASAVLGGAAPRRFGDADLAALGRIGRGQSLLEAGRTAAAGDLFDEAMVSVTAGELSPVVAGIVYCAVIDACHQAFDVRRAREWTDGLSRWCDDQQGLVAYRGQCLVHRSQVMQLNGAWAEALDEAHRARRRNPGPGAESAAPEPNNLLAFLHAISPRTHSLLLATATPVQLHPIEAWDLLDALGETIWDAQRNGKPLDANAYLERVRKLSSH